MRKNESKVNRGKKLSLGDQNQEQDMAGRRYWLAEQNGGKDSPRGRPEIKRARSRNGYPSSILTKDRRVREKTARSEQLTVRNSNRGKQGCGRE